jgi:hypothetical protein
VSWEPLAAGQLCTGGPGGPDGSMANSKEAVGAELEKVDFAWCQSCLLFGFFFFFFFFFFVTWASFLSPWMYYSPLVNQRMYDHTQ